MPPEIPYEFFAVLVSLAAFFVVRLLKIPPRFRRDAAKILIMAGVVAAGALSGFLRVNEADGVSLFAVVTVLAVFCGTGVVAFLFGLPRSRTHCDQNELEEQKKSDLPRNTTLTVVNERHDYTDVGKGN